MADVTQLIFVLYSLVSISECSDVVRLVGDSVQLDIWGPVPEFDDLFWMFNGSNNVLKYNKKYKDITLYSPYEDRVEFNDKTYSLTLKNLQKTDSGLYTARASAKKVKDVAEYRLSVLDPVETPVLTHQPNNDTCNITCTGQDLSISSSYYNETCEEQEVSARGITLSLSDNGSFIICNHSNAVSWNETVLEIRKLKQLCTNKGGNQNTGSGLNWLIPVVVAVLVVITAIIIIIFFIFRQQKKSTGSIQCDNTVYAEVENAGAEQSIMLETPSTVYSVVGKKPQPSSNGQSSQSISDEQQTILPEPGVPNTYESAPDKTQCVKPETIYAKVSKPSKPVNQSKLDETT